MSAVPVATPEPVISAPVPPPEPVNLIDLRVFDATKIAAMGTDDLLRQQLYWQIRHFPADQGHWKMGNVTELAKLFTEEVALKFEAMGLQEYATIVRGMI